MAKIVLRFVNFSCSLIVLSMLAATFTIFNATKQLPQRSGLPAWANQQSTWPQILMLVIACISLAMAVIILWTYWRSGHHRAEKVAVYYTVFAVAFFIFSIVMWAIGAAVLNTSKQNGNGQDMWGWSCKDNKRKTLFQEDVDYALVCRLQVCPLNFRITTHTNSFVELVSRLCHHRDRHRAHHDCNLRHRLLPILVEAQAPKVHGHP